MNITVSSTDLLKISGDLIKKADTRRMYEIAEAVAKNPALIADFDKDPLAAARKINGFEPPEGFHMHIVDANNVYHPQEDDALGQISSKAAGESWMRVEARAGYETIACTVCIWCKGI